MRIKIGGRRTAHTWSILFLRRYILDEMGCSSHERHNSYLSQRCKLLPCRTVLSSFLPPMKYTDIWSWTWITNRLPFCSFLSILSVEREEMGIRHGIIVMPKLSMSLSFRTLEHVSKSSESSESKWDWLGSGKRQGWKDREKERKEEIERVKERERARR